MPTVYSKISSKGQIVIPAQMRKNHHLKPGMKVVISDEGKKITIEPLNREFVRQFAGIIPKHSKVVEHLLEERKKDELRDQKKFG